MSEVTVESIAKKKWTFKLAPAGPDSHIAEVSG
jgi:hypothetical protein